MEKKNEQDRGLVDSECRHQLQQRGASPAARAFMPGCVDETAPIRAIHHRNASELAKPQCIWGRCEWWPELGFVRHAYSFWVEVGDHMYSLASSQHLILGHMSCRFLFLLFLSILCKCRPISCTKTQKGSNSAQRRRLSFAWRVDDLSFIRSPTPSFGIV